MKKQAYTNAVFFVLVMALFMYTLTIQFRIWEKGKV